MVVSATEDTSAAHRRGFFLLEGFTLNLWIGYRFGSPHILRYWAASDAGVVFLTDDSGNQLIDDAGNLLTE